MELQEQLPTRVEQPAEILRNAILGALREIPRLEVIPTPELQDIADTLSCMETIIEQIEYVVADELIYRGADQRSLP